MVVRDFTLQFEARPTCDIIDLTPEVCRRLGESGLVNGSVTLFVVGSTAGITTVEYESGLLEDLEEFYEKLIPSHRGYHHEQAWHDGNGFSHVRASLLKPDLTVPVIRGQLQLGTWQQIVLINFDNRRRSRRVVMQVMGV